ncbi:MAG: hypothetical protein M3Z31_18920 [Pseudomonadota bacterium]|nr:hypothetical protein [Pseudomonadota bacterium]
MVRRSTLVLLLCIGQGCTVAAAAETAERSAVAAPSFDARRFDGAWSVNIDCAGHSDGALGYTFQFPARVENGFLAGQNGREGQPSYLKLEGQIDPSGAALLSARGLTGEQKYSVDRVRYGSAYSYHAKAQFDETRGTGRRIELRKCDLTFIKQ